MIELVFYHSVPQDLLHDLQRDYPTVHMQQCQSRQALQEILPRAEILITFQCDPDLLELAPRLQWVQALSTGVDALPLDHFQKRNILLTSTRGIHAGHMSELALMAMLMLARNVHLILKNQTLQTWRQPPQDEIAGKTVGILGLGSIGREVARKASFLGMQAIGVKNRPETVDNVSQVLALEDMDKVFARSDYVINLLPLTEKTRQCIGSRQFDCMPEEACFINLGRGGSVDEKALIQALHSGSLRAVVSDVFAHEPLPADSPFWNMDNVIVLPHIGGLSVHYMHKALPVIRHNLQAYLEGRLEDMKNVYQPERGY
ncbi:MAG: D-2-hydroxyacid dehydrogenase [Desulfohalobiaceae bacterium]|nr:D-2-hydroxyacid dehydrogenase [Desulfohalobiaceae bacterium]